MKINKSANSQYDLLPVLNERWSPRAFDDSALAKEELMTILEAARWAPSSMNEQPWRFVFGVKNTPSFNKILQILKPGNASWAEKAGALVLVFGKSTFDRNGKHNRTWNYDLGLAVGNAVIQAQHMDIFAHQMGGIELEEAKKLYENDDYEPFVAVAFGRIGSIETLSKDLQQREISPRERKSLEEITVEA